MDGHRARALLGVSELATASDLRHAFRRRALALHPDHGGDVERFRELREALDTLLPDAPASREQVVYAPIDLYDVVPAAVARGRGRHATLELAQQRPSFADTLRVACAQWSSGN